MLKYDNDPTQLVVVDDDGIVYFPTIEKDGKVELKIHGLCIPKEEWDMANVRSKTDLDSAIENLLVLYGDGETKQAEQYA